MYARGLARGMGRGRGRIWSPEAEIGWPTPLEKIAVIPGFMMRGRGRGRGRGYIRNIVEANYMELTERLASLPLSNTSENDGNSDATTGHSHLSNVELSLDTTFFKTSGSEEIPLVREVGVPTRGIGRGRGRGIPTGIPPVLNVGREDEDVEYIPFKRFEFSPYHWAGVDERCHPILQKDWDTSVSFRQQSSSVLKELNADKKKTKLSRHNWQKEFGDKMLGEVVTNYDNEIYVISEILWDRTPTKTVFEWKGNWITFANYFKTQHGLTILDKDQPLLLSEIKPKKMKELYFDVERVCLVPELCDFTGFCAL